MEGKKESREGGGRKEILLFPPQVFGSMKKERKEGG